jgi:conjugal transfer pilus assembly protein TrbC
MKNTARLFAALLIAISSASTMAQSLSQAFTPQPWNTYVFVSTSIPRSTLRELAKQASQAKATLVLNGFEPKTRSLESTRAFIAAINDECCAKNPASWVIHPKLFEAFKVQKTPAFVLAQGQSGTKETFVSITGEMSLPNAYKFFAQNAATPQLQKKAAEIYTKTYTD